MNNDVKKYLSEIKSMIPFHSKDKVEFLKITEEKLMEFIDSKEDVDYQTIVKEFGKPNEVAASYIEEMDTDCIIKELRKKKYIKILIVVIILTTFIIGAFRIYYLTDLYNEFKDNQPVKYEDIIEEE